jgi:hypothetical protein
VPALQNAAAEVLHEQSLADIGAHTVLQLGLYQYLYGIFNPS